MKKLFSCFAVVVMLLAASLAHADKFSGDSKKGDGALVCSVAGALDVEVPNFGWWARLTVFVTKDGQPLSGADVSLTALQPGKILNIRYVLGKTKTDSDGKYSVDIAFEKATEGNVCTVYVNVTTASGESGGAILWNQRISSLVPFVGKHIFTGNIAGSCSEIGSMAVVQSNTGEASGVQRGDNLKLESETELWTHADAFASDDIWLPGSIGAATQSSSQIHLIEVEYQHNRWSPVDPAGLRPSKIVRVRDATPKANAGIEIFPGTRQISGTARSMTIPLLEPQRTVTSLAILDGPGRAGNPEEYPILKKEVVSGNDATTNGFQAFTGLTYSLASGVGEGGLTVGTEASGNTASYYLPYSVDPLP